MAGRETSAKSVKKDSDSIGIKIMMAIIAVAVVVLTFINAVPVCATGKTDTESVSEKSAVTIRSTLASYNTANTADVVEI